MTAPASKPAAKKAAAKPSSNGAAKRAVGTRPSDQLSKERLLDFYRSMVLIRRFEEEVIALFREGELPGFLHVAIGQEGIATGVSEALDKGDFIGSTHRAHGHILAKGSSPVGMMAELMGRDSGYCRGKGGSMHLADMQHNVVGANGVVGAGGPMMIGVGLTQKMHKTGKVAVVYYGDGASNQGNIFEAMNLAQLWKLPTIFVCEDNGYAESTPKWQQVPVDDLSVRGLAFGMKTFKVDGNDVLAVYDAAVEAREFAASGEGPVYFVAETKRFEGHYIGDAEVYRPKGEKKEWKKADPIPRFEQDLLARDITQADLDKVAEEIDAVVADAIEQARAADLPAPEAAMHHIYDVDDYPGPVLGV